MKEGEGLQQKRLSEMLLFCSSPETCPEHGGSNTPQSTAEIRAGTTSARGGRAQVRLRSQLLAADGTAEQAAALVRLKGPGGWSQVMLTHTMSARNGAAERL